MKTLLKLNGTSAFHRTSCLALRVLPSIMKDCHLCQCCNLNSAPLAIPDWQCTPQNKLKGNLGRPVASAEMYLMAFLSASLNLSQPVFPHPSRAAVFLLQMPPSSGVSERGNSGTSLWTPWIFRERLLSALPLAKHYAVCIIPGGYGRCGQTTAMPPLPLDYIFFLLQQAAGMWHILLSLLCFPTVTKSTTTVDTSAKSIRIARIIPVGYMRNAFAPDDNHKCWCQLTAHHFVIFEFSVIDRL